MKKKINVIVFALLVAVLLSSCSLKVCQFAHINYNDGSPVYTCKTVYQRGPVEPVVTVINPYRQMTRR